MIRTMNFTLSFLTDANYWVLMVLGCLALLPRARYTADRMAALTPADLQRIKPRLAQRACLLIPGICVFACVVMFGYATGAALLLVMYLLVYVGIIIALKDPAPR
ncbi:MAG: hypothetical protein AAGL98_09385 [Planctomycetota bacterium]